MSSECKGICDSSKESQRKFGYENGQKYCPKCTRYFFTELTICYCCKNKLRTKSREYRKMKITMKNYLSKK